MKTGIDKETNTASDEDENVRFSQVTAVATGWMLDFLFIRVCRRFKEGDLDGFGEVISTFESISQRSSLHGAPHDEKTKICAFLARVMHGKQLDVFFEEDKSVMPLMSATKIWSNLKETVADESLFENIALLLLVQSIAVCLEKGQRSSASSALEWFENNHDFQKNVRVKLTTVVSQTDTYNPLLMNFTFSRLRETIQSYLDAYLEKNPSDYLLKAATEAVQSSPDIGVLKDTVTQHKSNPEEAVESNQQANTRKDESTLCLRPKRKLLSTNTDMWKPDSCKKARDRLRRISTNELSQLSASKSVDTTMKPKKRKTPQKWDLEMDKKLRAGVKRHGEGNWALILSDDHFGGRTGTMLKDRWRVLMKAKRFR